MKDLEGPICVFLIAMNFAPLRSDWKTVPRGLGAYRGVTNHVSCLLARDSGPFGLVFCGRHRHWPLFNNSHLQVQLSFNRLHDAFWSSNISKSPPLHHPLANLCLGSLSLVSKTSRPQRRTRKPWGTQGNVAELEKNTERKHSCNADTRPFNPKEMINGHNFIRWSGQPN
jgi:hypothetical protein